MDLHLDAPKPESRNPKISLKAERAMLVGLLATPSPLRSLSTVAFLKCRLMTVEARLASMGAL